MRAMSWSSELFAADPTPDDDEAWAASGLLALSGPRDAVPRLPPRSVVPAGRALGTSIERLAAELGASVRIDPLARLAERAAIAGLERDGRRSCGGATELHRTSDGWIAVSLARPDDVDLLPTWLGVEDPAAIGAAVQTSGNDDLVATAAELGLAVAALGEVAVDDDVVGATPGRAGTPHTELAGTLVVDLSSLWAGPLCASLLADAGARVVKVESVARPDGARRGPPDLFDRLHAGHESVAVDLGDERHREALRELIAGAGIVVEASRPRALEQLRLDPTVCLDGRDDLVWISLTGYGRQPNDGRRVAFGDDAAVAGGLVTGTAADPTFCADAVADPLSGMTAAAAALDRWRAGGSWLVDVAMARVAAWCARSGPADRVWAGDVVRPRWNRRPSMSARPMGHDTAAVLGLDP